jgi:hypothetical protein
MLGFLKKLFGSADVNKDGRVDAKDAKVAAEAVARPVLPRSRWPGPGNPKPHPRPDQITCSCAKAILARFLPLLSHSMSHDSLKVAAQSFTAVFQ